MSRENTRLVHGLVKAVAKQNLERLIELTVEAVGLSG